MDSYEINKPELFFSDKDFYDKTVFISNKNEKNFKDVFNINNNITIQIFFYLLCSMINFRKFFKGYDNLNSLYIRYSFEKKIYKNFFKNNKINFFLSSFVAQPFTSSAVAARIHDLKGFAFGYTFSLSLHDYSSHLNIDAFDYFF